MPGTAAKVRLSEKQLVVLDELILEVLSDAPRPGSPESVKRDRSISTARRGRHAGESCASQRQLHRRRGRTE